MNATARTCSTTRWTKRLRRHAGLVLGTLALVLGVDRATSFAQGVGVTVTTLGGGRLTSNGADAGFTDGNSLQMSQFNTPSGCAVDSSGRLYVADRSNGALRQLDLNANRCRTVLTGLNQPVAVAVDATNVVYVASQGDGKITRVQRGVPSLLTQQLTAPTALAYDGHGNLFVTQADGSVMEVRTDNGSVSGPILTGLSQPQGIAVLDSGLIAVSESGANLIRIWDPQSGSVQLQIGTGGTGFTDGPAEIARLSRPWQLAKAPSGALVVADRGNHRVRMIDLDGFVSTVYGVDPATWEGPTCTTCTPIILPGWLDGPAEFAEARDPIGVGFASDGTLYTTEGYYDLVRQVAGAFTGGSSGGNGGSLVVLPPTLSPASGYYPMGQTIVVTDPNVGSFLPRAIYYTTDGSEPTTNSTQVALNGNTGSIFWQDKLHDLTSLRLKTYLGANPSPITSGQAVSASEIGVPQDIAGGIGSTVIVPVVVNLRTNDQLKSLQFRVEVAPATPNALPIPDSFQALSYSTNDFITLATSSSGGGEAVFRAAPYQFDQTRGMAIAFLGTNANFNLKSCGVVALLSLPIPPGAQLGDRYTVQVLNASGTADAGQQQVALSPMPARTLTIAPAQYMVGDCSTATWYNALSVDASGAMRPGFGDHILDNSDVNNVFAAALGVRMPYPGTDLFDAMDAFPEDTPASAGGDGAIRFLDWQVILMRSLGLSSVHWERAWSDGGLRIVAGSPTSGLADTPGQTLTAPPPGAIWTRQVRLSAQTVENVIPGVAFDVPVSVDIEPGCQLAGLAFRTIVEPQGAAPALTAPVQFIPNPDIPAPPQNAAASMNTALCGWPLVPSSSFDPALQGSNRLGAVRITLPVGARGGQSYTVRFANADGSPDLQTQYDFETTPGSVWVLSSAQRPTSTTSDEWKMHFFGSLQSAAAADDADPDQDGVPNWAEYLAGTDPTNAQSNLHLGATQVDASGKRAVLHWLSAPGKRYQIEASPNLTGGNWTVVAANLPGDGQMQEWVQPSPTSQTGFYRIRVQP